MRVLLLCPVATTERASEVAAELWPHSGSSGRIDVVVYGRSSSEVPAPEGTRRVALPQLDGPVPARAWRLIRFVGRLRRRRYSVAAIVHPSLSHSHSRGPLVAFPLIAGAREVALVDLAGRRVAGSVRSSTAAVDLIRWVGLQAAATITAALIARVLERAASRPPPVSGPIPAGGSVMYLRTDVDLASAPALAAGGSATHTDGIVRALRRRGHPLELWSTGAIAGLPGDVPRRSVPVINVGNLPTEIAELASSAVQMLGAPRRPAVSAFIYQRHSLNNLTGLFLARRWGVPLVLEANASEVKWRRDWGTLRFARLGAACERLLLSRADRITAVSENAAREIVQAGADRDRVRIVPNGVDFERFASARPRSVPFSKDSFVVGFAGLFYPWHGVRYLADAFTILAPRHGDMRLMLVGDGEHLPSVRATLKEAGLLDAVHMPGIVAREEVPGYLAAADVLVSPHADVEGFVGSPTKIFEYMASGRAIVASGVAQIADVLRDGETALVVPPGDPIRLAHAISRLRQEPDLRLRLGRQAQEEARETSSWDVRLGSILDGNPTP